MKQPADANPRRRWLSLTWLLTGTAITLGLIIHAAPGPVESLTRPVRGGPVRGVSLETSQPLSIGTHTRNIEDIRIGDPVIAADPETGEMAVRRVTEVFRHTSDHLRILTIRAGDVDSTQTLKTTDEHPFWVPDHGWTNAADLEPGDEILQDAGGYRPDRHPVRVARIHIRSDRAVDRCRR